MFGYINYEFLWLASLPFQSVFGEGDGGEGGEDEEGVESDAGGEKPAGDKPAGVPKGKTYTDEQVQQLIKTERVKSETSKKSMLKELEALRTSTSITAEERNTLDARIDQLTGELSTKEENTKRDREKLEKKYQKDLSDVVIDRDHWKERYKSETITRTIEGAAVEEKAFSPEQIYAILAPKTELTEILDEGGKSTGKLEPRVTMSVTEKGEAKTVKLPVLEAVKRMKEDPKHKNLFQSDGSGGTGSYSIRANKEAEDIASLARTDPEAYIAARRANKIKI